MAPNCCIRGDIVYYSMSVVKCIKVCDNGLKGMPKIYIYVN